MILALPIAARSTTASSNFIRAKTMCPVHPHRKTRMMRVLNACFDEENLPAHIDIVWRPRFVAVAREFSTGRRIAVLWGALLCGGPRRTGNSRSRYPTDGRSRPDRYQDQWQGGYCRLQDRTFADRETSPVPARPTIIAGSRSADAWRFPRYWHAKARRSNLCAPSARRTLRY